MKIIITDDCIGCYSCIYECPVGALLDRHENPEGKDIFYIQQDVCVQCVGHHDTPVCMFSCSMEETIIDEHNPPEKVNKGIFAFLFKNK